MKAFAIVLAVVLSVIALGWAVRGGWKRLDPPYEWKATCYTGGMKTFEGSGLSLIISNGGVSVWTKDAQTGHSAMVTGDCFLSLEKKRGG